MADNQPVPQRIITISISGVGTTARVFYSYTSPIYGITFLNVPTCDISIDQPTYTMFVLDFASSMNGWVFKGVLPRHDANPLPTVLAENTLSLTTFNPYDPEYPDHSYYIEYYNTVTEKGMKRDPQELNVPDHG